MQNLSTLGKAWETQHTILCLISTHICQEREWSDNAGRNFHLYCLWLHQRVMWIMAIIQSSICRDHTNNELELFHLFPILPCFHTSPVVHPQPHLGNWKNSARKVEWLTLQFTNLQNRGNSDKKRDAVCFSSEVLTSSFHSSLTWALCHLSLIFFSSDRHSETLQPQCCVRVFSKEPEKHPLLSNSLVLGYTMCLQETSCLAASPLPQASWFRATWTPCPSCFGPSCSPAGSRNQDWIRSDSLHRATLILFNARMPRWYVQQMKNGLRPLFTTMRGCCSLERGL